MDYFITIKENLSDIWKGDILNQQYTRVNFHERFYCQMMSKHMSPFPDEVKFRLVVIIEKLFLSMVILIPPINEHLRNVFKAENLLKDANTEIESDEEKGVRKQASDQTSTNLPILTISSNVINDPIRAKFKTMNVDWKVLLRDALASFIWRMPKLTDQTIDDLRTYVEKSFILSNVYQITSNSYMSITADEKLMFDQLKVEILNELDSLKNLPSDQYLYKQVKMIFKKKLEMLGAKRVRGNYTIHEKRKILEICNFDIENKEKKHIFNSMINCYTYVIFKTNLNLNFDLNNSVRFLFKSGYELVDIPKNGSIIVYGYFEGSINQNFCPLHFGIWDDGKVVSKWGKINIYESGVDELPLNYGNGYLIFNEKTSNNEDI